MRQTTERMHHKSGVLMAFLVLFCCHVKSRQAAEGDEESNLGMSPELVDDCDQRIDECYGRGVVINNMVLAAEQRTCLDGFRCRGDEDAKRQMKMAHLDVERIEKLLSHKGMRLTSRNSATASCEAAQIIVFVCATIGRVIVY